jgi:hypothetical protein
MVMLVMLCTLAHVWYLRSSWHLGLLLLRLRLRLRLKLRLKLRLRLLPRV